MVKGLLDCGGLHIMCIGRHRGGMIDHEGVHLVIPGNCFVWVTDLFRGTTLCIHRASLEHSERGSGVIVCLGRFYRRTPVEEHGWEQ